MVFYGAPTVPAGIFDDFLEIPYLRTDIGTRGMASMANVGNYSGQIFGHRWVIKSLPLLARGGAKWGEAWKLTIFRPFHRTYFNTVSVRSWTPSLINLVEGEARVSSAHVEGLLRRLEC